MRKLIIIPLLLLAGAFSVHAQQLPVSSHYLVNPAALNPAFAGIANQSEFFINYRQDWGAIEGSPRTIGLNADFNLYRNMQLGADILADFADIFYRLRAGLSYSIHVEVAEKQLLSFGLWGHFYQNVIRLDQANVDFDDPIFKDLNRLFSSNLGTGFGLVYTHHDFQAAFGMPVLFRTRNQYNFPNDTAKFAFERDLHLYLTNSFYLAPDWDFRPGLLLRKPINMPSYFDVSGTFVYNKQVWIGALFRSTSLFGFSAGVRLFDGMVFNYTFEVGAGGIHRYAGNTHEVSIGFTKPASKNRKEKTRRPTDRERYDIRDSKYFELRNSQKPKSDCPDPVTPKSGRLQPLKPVGYAPYEKR